MKTDIIKEIRLRAAALSSMALGDGEVRTLAVIAQDLSLLRERVIERQRQAQVLADERAATEARQNAIWPREMERGRR